MGLLFDSFWRAAVYCLLPRVIALSLLPLALLGAIGAGLGYFFWDSAVVALQAALEQASWLGYLWRLMESFGMAHAPQTLAPALLVMVATPLLVMTSLLVVSFLMTPTLVKLVAARRFPALEKLFGASMLSSIAWSLGSTAMALAAVVASMPLWLIPPLVLLLPPLIWGWLTYRVMAFDVLSEHASKQERAQLMQRHRFGLLCIGVLTGYMGAAPAVVWASGVVFAAAFFVLVPLAIWIYTLVFVFSSLWFAHFCLLALQQMRAESSAKDVMPPLASSVAVSPQGAESSATPLNPPFHHPSP